MHNHYGYGGGDTQTTAHVALARARGATHLLLSLHRHHSKTDTSTNFNTEWFERVVQHANSSTQLIIFMRASQLGIVRMKFKLCKYVLLINILHLCHLTPLTTRFTTVPRSDQKITVVHWERSTFALMERI